MKVMEFDSVHMYSHILVGVGQSVLYQCKQFVYVCVHVHICDVNVCMQHANVCVHSLYHISLMYTTYSVKCTYHSI